MTTALPTHGLQLRSLITSDGQLQLSLVDTPVSAPKEDEVVVRVEATPINPSDIGLLFGAADMATAQASGTATQPVVTATVPERAMKAMAGRLGQSMPVGNEGAGTVVAAGTSAAAQALLGKTVAVLGGAMYSQYRTVPAAACLALPAGATAAQGASCFVNPLTALGMVETMQREGHTALVHTAAASNLGQMLNRICQADGVGLVNIVRKPEQVALLRDLGAQHVVDSSAPGFQDALTDALAATGATLAFDAIGGGKLAGQILQGMEAAIARSATEYSRYGSTVHKQVYLYGGLDTSPTEITRSFGMTWGVGGWLMFPFLQRIGAEATQRLKDRVAAELHTTFASHYSRTVSLAQALSLEAIAQYGPRSTGTKVLINPNAG
ncbi:MAG: NADH oxidase [Burkholderiales bacterium PBB5]|nr:MAG: NADH oxidase [Burkholderiales bacterium PBB5]